MSRDPVGPSAGDDAAPAGGAGPAPDVPVRLFTALWPPPAVLDALETAVTASGLARRPGWRPVPSARWHVTLAFHGDDRPEPRIRALDRLAGCRAPRLRLAGTGTFPGVLWAGVQTADADDATALERLVAGAGAVPDGFVGHLTLARATGRGRSGRDGDGQAPEQLPVGPWWTPAEVLLVISERTADGVRYRPLHRVPLAVDTP